MLNVIKGNVNTVNPISNAVSSHKVKFDMTIKGKVIAIVDFKFLKINRHITTTEP